MSENTCALYNAMYNFQFPFTVHIYREKIKYHDMEGCWGLHKVHLDWKEGRNNICDWIPLPQKRGILKSRQWQSSKILFTIHSVKWNDIFHQYWKFQVWAQVFNSVCRQSRQCLGCKTLHILLRLVKFQFEELAYNLIMC